MHGGFHGSNDSFHTFQLAPAWVAAAVAAAAAAVVAAALGLGAVRLDAKLPQPHHCQSQWQSW